jgi:non-specific serine/threonine protein kinase/serine/threonine-protein kinase
MPESDSMIDATWPRDLGGEALRDQATVGNYRLLEQVGAGGMGVVYKAEQRWPIQRIVALKLIKFGIDSPQVVARFESERQALAMFDHPGVARIHDAGVTETGRPYFVMEYVPGVPINEYCDANHLTTAQRLELFEQVCHAVQHAHFKGILHRDLKPSNILVTETDGRAQPKVIDFGVAKAVNRQPIDDLLTTHAGQLVGTPLYMSPEQAGGDDVDSRADVYSLGVVLYELLCGALPFDPTSLRRGDSITIARHLRETDPPQPSTRVRQLRGDLDRIVMKAMHKDRSQRYATAATLAEDVRRHLNHEPVLARPPTLAYQARKFARRNRVLVGMSALVCAAVLFGGVAATVGMVRARRALIAEAAARLAEQQQRQVAQNVSGFLGDMLASVDPRQAQGQKVLVRDVLDRAAKDLDARFVAQPLVAAALHTIVGETYYALGQFELARGHAQSALDLRRADQGPDHAETLIAQKNLAGMLRVLKRYHEAEPLLRDALDRLRRLAGPDDPQTVLTAESLALVLRDTNRAAEAEPLMRHALESKRRRFGRDDEHTLTSLNNMAAVLVELDRRDEAMAMYREAAEAQQRVSGPDHPSTLLAWTNLSTGLLQQARVEEAVTILRDVLPRSESVNGDDHPRTLLAMNNLAASLVMRQKLDEAEAAYRELLSRAARSLPEDHPDRIQAAADLALTLERREKLDDAVALYKDLFDLAHRSKTLSPKHAAMTTVPYGIALAKAGRYAEAEPALLESKRMLESAGMHGSSKMRQVLGALAGTYDRTDRRDEASGVRAEIERRRAASTSAAVR